MSHILKDTSKKQTSAVCAELQFGLLDRVNTDMSMFFFLYHVLSLAFVHKNKNAYTLKHSHACSLCQTFQHPKISFFVAENPPGICQHQTELIALNLSRNLKVSGHDDVIIGVTEVAWESSEIRSLTSLSVQHCIQSV